MKRYGGSVANRHFGIALALGSVIVAGAVTIVAAKDAGATPMKNKLTGEQLFAMNCNRCHTERYPTEFSKVQWKTLLMHMRVRANLPPAQAQAIYKYMSENK